MKKMPLLKELSAFIKERELIRHRKEVLKEPYPWTKDPILQKYSFCNIRREDDRVTKWIAKHWRDPYKNHPDLWFAMVVARLLNWPDTLTHIDIEELVLPLSPGNLTLKLREIQQSNSKLWGSAYMLTTVGKSISKIDYAVGSVLVPLWNARELIRPRNGDTLLEFHNRLSSYVGIGSFISAQVVADLKYVRPLNKADDWYTFAASGPGSRRGLSRLYGAHVSYTWKEDTWHQYLLNAYSALTPMIHPIELHMQDFQNCLCEFDKYMRAKMGEGRPKSTYKAPNDSKKGQLPLI